MILVSSNTGELSFLSMILISTVASTDLFKKRHLCLKGVKILENGIARISTYAVLSKGDRMNRMDEKYQWGIINRWLKHLESSIKKKVMHGEGLLI